MISCPPNALVPLLPDPAASCSSHAATFTGLVTQAARVAARRAALGPRMIVADFWFYSQTFSMSTGSDEYQYASWPSSSHVT